MSGGTTFTTTSSPVRRLVSPLSSVKSRNIAKGAMTTNDYSGQREDELASNSHGFTRSNISTPRVDSCILGKVTVEQRDKFTVSGKMGYFNIVFSLLKRKIESSATLTCMMFYFPAV